MKNLKELQTKAKQELAKRELARRKLLPFIEYNFEQYRANWHHKLLIEKLEQVERGEIKRLIVEMPPRHGKSEIVSVQFPSWYIGKNPDKSIITSCYASELATDFGGQTRNLINTKEYKYIFKDIKLAEDSQAKNNWGISGHRGRYVATGVGGAITGKGADVLLIDDPFKNREDADSPVIREKVWKWYTSTARTRLSPEGAIVIVHTRWHDEDLIGKILQSENADKWERLSLPAIAIKDETFRKIGEPLWESQYNLDNLMETKQDIGPYDWSALYQQDPIASSSNIFRLQDFRYHLSSDFERADGILKKEDLRCIIAVDPAFSTSKTSDDAVVMAWGKHKISGNYYLLDGYADTSAPSHTFQAILSMYDRVTADGYKVDFISIESVSISKDQTKFVTDFKSFLKERNRYLTVNEWKPEGKKEERIKFVLEPKASLNAISLRKDMADTSFVRKFENQIVDFPHGKHDDVIDCAAQAVDVLDKKGQLPESASKKTPMYFNRQTGRLEPVKSK
jgi:hypothetical protein